MAEVRIIGRVDAATGVVFTTGAAPQRVTPHGAVQVSVPGASAYQIAVQHGYEGTEAEWAASLDTSVLADALEDHVASADPHPNAVSTTSFAAWLDALTTGI